LYLVDGRRESEAKEDIEVQKFEKEKEAEGFFVGTA
jgi:hypothetical protein